MTKEGPVSVEGDVTPITRKPIQSIDSNSWHKMTVSELYDQMSILHGRMIAASQLGNQSMLQQLHFGVSQLQALIERKSEQIEEPKR